MIRRTFGSALLLAVVASGVAHAAPVSSLSVGDSGRSYASSRISCAAAPDGTALVPVAWVGLFSPAASDRALAWLNRNPVARLSYVRPLARLPLAYGSNSAAVAFSRRVIDRYAFEVPAIACAMDESQGNTYSADGTLEYGAAVKSYATVLPGCAVNPLTGVAQPYLNLFDGGDYLLNVSINGEALTQLGPTRPHTVVFLVAGRNVISVADASQSTEYYVRDTGDGMCDLPG